MLTDEHIAGLSDKELENLHANAQRLLQSGTAAQRSSAEQLLPMISASLEDRRTAKAAAQQEKRRTAVKKTPAKRAAKSTVS